MGCVGGEQLCPHEGSAPVSGLSPVPPARLPGDKSLLLGGLGGQHCSHHTSLQGQPLRGKLKAPPCLSMQNTGKNYP